MAVQEGLLLQCPPRPKACFLLSPKEGQQHGDREAGFGVLSAARGPSPVSHELFLGQVCVWLGPQEPSPGCGGSGMHGKGFCTAELLWPAFTDCLSEKKYIHDFTVFLSLFRIYCPS